MARRAEQMVLLPVHRRVPSNRVRAFFQEGLENSTEKGRRTGRMWSDRELINLADLVVQPNSVGYAPLSINFFLCSLPCGVCQRVGVKMYKVEVKEATNAITIS